MIAAFGVAELNVYDKVGKIKSGTAHRYGPENAKSRAANSSAVEDLPMENAPGAGLPNGEALSARMNTFGALLDITHPHVFEIPIVLFILAHFLMRTRAGEWFKLATYAAAFGGMASFIAAPWLVRYWSVSWTPSLYIGAGLMGVTVIIMVVVPLWEMWWPSSNGAALTQNGAVSAAGG